MDIWSVTLRVSVPGQTTYDAFLVNILAETIEEAIVAARTAVIVDPIKAEQTGTVPPP